ASPRTDPSAEPRSEDESLPRTRPARDIDNPDEPFSEDLPDDLPEEVYRMGRPITVYKPSVWKQGAGMFSGFLIVGAGAAASVAGIVLALIGRGGFRPGFLVLVPIGALVVFLGMLVVIYTYRNFSLRVAVFLDGLVRVRHGVVDIYYWDEIEAV